MEYIIAGLRIDIPREFTTGAFGMALAPFAAKEAAGAEGKSATDANEAAGAEGKGATDANEAAGAESQGVPSASKEAADAEWKVTTDADANEAAGAEPQGAPSAAKEAAPDNTGKSPSEAAATTPPSRADGTAQYGLSIRTAQQVGEGADYRELDAFDFAEADADCRFGRDAEGYLLTITPRDGSTPARFRKAFGSPIATSDITLRHKPALFRFGLWTLFNIAAMERQAVAVHSSVICLDGRAVLFLGESGTGKSTHTRLWREHIPGAKLLNDDSPIVRIASAPTSAGLHVPEENMQAPCATSPGADESVPPLSEKRLADMRSQKPGEIARIADTGSQKPGVTARIADSGSQRPGEIAQSAQKVSLAPGETARIADGSQKPCEGTCAAEGNRSSENWQADVTAHDPAPGSDTSGIQCSGSEATAAHSPVASTRIPGTQSLGVPPPSRQADTPEVVACGSPWSGKTPCYRNESYPIAGIVRLSQAPHNRIRRLRPIEAIGALLPSCPPSFAHDERLSDAVCRLVSGIVAQVPVYHLECLPDAAAAELACKTVLGR